MQQKNFALAVFSGLILSLNTFAQDIQETPENSADELANPNATLGTMAVPIDFTFFNGDLPDAKKPFSTTLNFQPSLPIPLSQGVNLFVRPLIPIILTQPSYGANGFEQKEINLGNRKHF